MNSGYYTLQIYPRVYVNMFRVKPRATLGLIIFTVLIQNSEKQWNVLSGCLKICPRELPRANFSRQPLRTFHCLYQISPIHQSAFPHTTFHTSTGWQASCGWLWDNQVGVFPNLHFLDFTHLEKGQLVRLDEEYAIDYYGPHCEWRRKKLTVHMWLAFFWLTLLWKCESNKWVG